MRLFITLWSLIFFFDLSNVSALEIPHFAQVTDQISRGGRPAYRDLEELLHSQYKLIINLEHNASAIERETAWSHDLGIENLSLPMEWETSPTDTQIDVILKLLSDEARWPIFIHCKHGQDRTGLIIGLYRVLIQKWEAQRAYEEMLSLGFHPEYTALTNYFWSRTSAPRVTE